MSEPIAGAVTTHPDVHPHPRELHGNPFMRKIGPLPVIAWAGIIVLLYIVYTWYKNRNASTTATVDPNATTGSGLAPDASTYGGGLGAGSVTGMSGGGSGIVTTGPSGATTNAQWASMVASDMIAGGANPSDVSNALSDYLNGNQLSPTEEALINAILAKYGPPPQGVLPVQAGTGTGTGTGTTTPTVADGYYRDPITTAIYEVYNGQIWHLTPTEWKSIDTAEGHYPSYTSVDSSWPGYQLPKGSGTPPGTSDTPATTTAPPSQAPSPAPPKPKPVQSPPHTTARTYTVKSGDSLYSIAQHFYGNGNDWTKIYDANKSKIGSNPNLIHVGTVLTIP